MDFIRDLKLRHDNFYREEADPRVKDWLLLWGSPVYAIGLSLVYVIFVTWLGPRLMRDRKSMDLKIPMVLYNFFLVGLSLYMVVEIILSGWDAGYGFLCATYNKKSQDPSNVKEMRVARVLWWYFFSKALELLDTVFMVLRKKTAQITFLHVFHHASMLILWWWIQSFLPGGQSWIGSSVNSSVHVVMYLYYGLAALPSARPYLWWKKYITWLQLLQFTFLFGHSVYSLFLECEFPNWGRNVLAGYCVLMFILFSNFYLHAYTSKSRPSDGKSSKQARGSSPAKPAGVRRRTRRNT